MCEYCDKEDPKSLSERKFSSHHEAYTGIECFVDSENGILIIQACLDNMYVEPIYKEIEIKINYCPMCRRKLSGMEDLFVK